MVFKTETLNFVFIEEEVAVTNPMHRLMKATKDTESHSQKIKQFKVS